MDLDLILDGFRQQPNNYDHTFVQCHIVRYEEALMVERVLG